MTTKKFYVMKGDRQYGPFSQQRIEELYRKGKIDPKQGHRVVSATTSSESSRSVRPSAVKKSRRPRKERSFSDLIDVDFDRMIAVRITSGFWLAWVVIIIVMTLIGFPAAIVFSLWYRSFSFLLVYVAWVIFAIFGTVFIRVWLEFAVSVLKIAENTSVLREQQNSGRASL